MNAKNDFALVPRPSTAIEKVEPGARRILSVIVTDMLALAPVGDPETLLQRGRAYLEGDGVPQDYTEAVKWFRKEPSRSRVEEPSRGSGLGGVLPKSPS